MKNEVTHTTRYESLSELCTDLDESNHQTNWQKIRAKKVTYKSLSTSLEMIKTIGEYINSKTVNEISGSPFLSLMGDEVTDIKNCTELSVCMQYLTTAGYTNECFLDIQNVPDETAEVIIGGIISIIDSRGIKFSKVVWLAFDGASYMSGHISKAGPNEEWEMWGSHIHSLSKPPFAAYLCSIIRKFFSAMNSLWHFLLVPRRRMHSKKFKRPSRTWFGIGKGRRYKMDLPL